MKRLIFLVSGNGGNLKFIAKYIREISSNEFKIEAVIADRECGALKYAQNQDLQSFLIDYSRDQNYELKKLLSELSPDVVITNIHKILDTDIVSCFKNKLINLHYSLLPAYKGLIGVKPIQAALKIQSKFIGSTVHFVDGDVDSGEIISQCTFSVQGIENFNEVVETVFQGGCLNLLNGLFILFDMSALQDNNYSSTVRLLERDCIFSPALRYDVDFLNKDFWDKVKHDQNNLSMPS